MIPVGMDASRCRISVGRGGPVNDTGGEGCCGWHPWGARRPSRATACGAPWRPWTASLASLSASHNTTGERACVREAAVGLVKWSWCGASCRMVPFRKTITTLDALHRRDTGGGLATVATGPLFTPARARAGAAPSSSEEKEASLEESGAADCEQERGVYGGIERGRGGAKRRVRRRRKKNSPEEVNRRPVKE